MRDTVKHFLTFLLIALAFVREMQKELYIRDKEFKCVVMDVCVCVCTL